MSLALPAALIWTALAIPILVFYILKIRMRRVPVSTTLFWRQIFDEQQPRSLWQNLRHWISLAVQLLLLMLLIFALAEPFFTWEVLAARKVVLVVDNSASMKATDVAPTRLDEAKRRATAVISGLRFRDELAIVVAGSEPQVVVGMTGHSRTLQDALTSVQPSDGPTRVPEAVALAKRLIGTHPHGQVIVLSDGCFEGSEALATRPSSLATPAGPTVSLNVIGTRVGNVGITRFQVRRSLVDPLGYEILAEVHNASKDPVECRLELELNGSPVDVVPLKLKPDQVWSQTFEKASADGGNLIAKLNRPDALASDNTAWALLPKREVQPVLLVTEGNLFLQKAFEANPLVKLTTTKTMPKVIPGGTIVVLHRKVPPKLPAGSIFVVDPTGSSDLWQIGGKLENPIVTKQDKDSPLVAHVRLDNVILPEARQLTFKDPPQQLVGALNGESLYAAVERPNGKVLVLTVNLDEGDLTFRTAFPILITNALGWFAGKTGELRESLATGAVTEIDLPKAAPKRPLALWTPEGKQRPLPGGVEKTTVGPLDQAGVWSVAPALEKDPTKPDDAKLELACNLSNRPESDLRPAESLVKSTEASPLAAGWFTRPIWFYLLVLAWLLAGLEWFMYQRRVIS